MYRTISASSLVLLFLVFGPVGPRPAAAQGTLDSAYQALSAAVPRTAEGFLTTSPQKVAQAAQALEAVAADRLLAAQRAAEQPPEPPVRPRLQARLRRQGRGAPEPTRGAAPSQSPVPLIEPLLLAKYRVDYLLQESLALRTQFTELAEDPQKRVAVRNYLKIMTTLIDLTGRLRYLQYDAIGSAAGAVAEVPAERERLVTLLTRYRSTIGATVMADLLFDLEGDSPEALAVRASDGLKSRVLQLIASSRQSDLLPELADYVLDAPASAALVLQAAEVIRTLGLPQDPRPNGDPTLPPVAITAAELHERLNELDPKKLDTAQQARHTELLNWLAKRMKQGVTEEQYTLGQGGFAPGDWLLMRNPSPYNLFTDISPGLFTHVGVVARETGPDGISRIVLVDLPERGSKMPATTVDTFVKRTRHYVVLRHKDPEIARQMGEAAASMIGNETQFDLNFRTHRVKDLAGQPLAGKKIHTYCAGLLLLCALQTGHAREEFFPVAEYASGGNTQDNLKTFGMSIGEDFISPTGALFSDQFKIVAQREPMYDARREVEEAIYDHFAQQMITARIQPTGDAFQALRLKVAQASQTNPLLAQALASAANVNAEMDLVAAAKAAAVIETLDEVAVGSSGTYLQAQQALRSGSAEQLAAGGMKPDEIAALMKLRQRHADLYQRWTSRQITPRALRLALVQYYVAQGRDQLNKRFFGGSSK